ncbi:uncharacterized protein LTR77_010234 [Saxophila tyrrhenica]|uniref:Uncharacterized protein n=1 Tax=Saxophila tyrrhenica TaxID=1690608 RepID=A0AAV9P088_9PEZI|nr:hypothetical protein LTR77_010234 [Saxophila tyrrhenica]
MFNVLDRATGAAHGDVAHVRPGETAGMGVRSEACKNPSFSGDFTTQSEKKPEVRSVPSFASCSTTTEVLTWLPTFMRPRPLVGLASLLLAALCLLASFAVLLASNGKPLDTWTWQPSVFLAVLSAVSNICVRFSLAQAFPIAWWYRASCGRTIADLHRHWEAGQGLLHAIRHAKHTSWLTAAAIASALVIIDGPLLQRASFVKEISQSMPTTLNFKLTPELPNGYSGFYVPGGFAISPSALRAVSDYKDDIPITADVSGCGGICTTTVRAPGVQMTDCSTDTWTITTTMINDSSAAWGTDSNVVPAFVSTIEAPAATHDYVGRDFMSLRVGIVALDDWSGSYTETTCTLVSAILNYHVQVEGNTVRISQPPDQSKDSQVANNTALNASSPVVPMTFTVLGEYLLASIYANVTFSQASGLRSKGGPNSLNTDTLNEFSLRYLLDTPGHDSLGFSDPTADIVAAFNSLMFRAGVAASGLRNTTALLDPGISVSQSVPAIQERSFNAFESDFRWFAGAALLHFVAIVTIIPVFWGWWTLGVNVTMSPFEIANVFEAPLLRDTKSTAGSRGVVEAVGDAEVKFGAVLDTQMTVSMDEKGRDRSYCTTTARLAVARAEKVIRPWRGMRFGH